MAEADDLVELLFFDTFSHEFNEDFNLDLVQFPKPVYITEIRIIPLGARVQADFPGGVRLGATNPSKFRIEFFVNDLANTGACTFESLGNLEYNQNDCIHLECLDEKIPTDGLILKGWYTTITLAVYGTLTTNLAEPIASPPPIESITEEVSVTPIPVSSTPDDILKENSAEWRGEVEVQPPPLVAVDGFERETYQESPFEENFETVVQINDDSNLYAPTSRGGSRELEKRPVKRRSPSSDRSSSRNRTYSRSDSNEREYTSRQKRDWSHSPEYRRSCRNRRGRSRDHEHKRPRTPPPQIDSPRRPRSPDDSASFSEPDDDSMDSRNKSSSLKSVENKQPIGILQASKESPPITSQPQTPLITIQKESATEEIQEPSNLDDEGVSQDEPFEPILSDDEIIGDDNNDNEPEGDEIELGDDFDDAIKLFDPFKMEINRFEMNSKFDMYFKDRKTVVGFLEKYKEKTKFDNQESFLNSNADEKENFVDISEQFVTKLSSMKKRDLVLKQLFNAEDGQNYLQIAVNVLKIGLDFQCAYIQPEPAVKIRHIKIGVKIAENLGASEIFLEYLINSEGYDPFNELFSLYSQEYMALSIKLMILKAIYALLDTKFGINYFINDSKLNGYQRLLMLLQVNPQTRIKFALKSIIKKLNLFEALDNIRELITKTFILSTDNYSDSVFAELDICFKEVLKALCLDTVSYQQPKRFFPVTKKFEIMRDIAAENSWTQMLSSYFRIHSLAESLLMIISNQNYIPTVLLDTVLDFIQRLVTSSIGIDYFVEDCFETAQLLVKCLLGVDDTETDAKTPQSQKDEEEGEIDDKEKERKIPTKPVSRAQKLGVHLAFAIQSRYHIDSITHIQDNADLLVEHLHALYSQTCYHPGREYTVETIGLSNNILPLLKLIDKERQLQARRQEGSPGIKYKSPVLSYSVDILDCIVRHCTSLEYLIEHGQVLIDLVKNHEIFEPSVSAVLQEMSVYLKPLEAIPNFSYDDITPFCDVIKRSIEYITTFPGDLIMSLRILEHLSIENGKINTESETKELKQRYVLLQFYSADGVATLLNILEKLNTYFEQPGLHSPSLMTMQAVHACQIILPTIRILREMLTFCIQCRDTEFKDVTAIEHLMRTYCLMHYFPEASQAYDEAQQIKSEIVKTLLAYTQPNQLDLETVHKSLWTQMVHEVIKSILHGPSTFIPGLQAFAELLPLPLPIPSLIPLTDAECQRLLTERKLWSAHLHPESSYIAELIQTICPSSFPQLTDLLTRVCLQLADLAPNMTLLVSKTITDLITVEYSNCNGGVGSQSLARYLKFFSQLTAYASVKVSSLSLLSGKFCDCFNQILMNSDQSDVHLQCQQSIHRILENFFDSELTMISPNSLGNLELNLACALPLKELIPSLVNAIAINALNSNITETISVSALRTLIILTEHDITFYHLRKIILTKKEQFQHWIKKITEPCSNGETNQLSQQNCDLLSTLVIFLRALIQIDETSADSLVPNRTMKFTIPEIIELLDITATSSNPFKKIKEILENQENKNENLLSDLNSFLESFENPMEIDQSNIATCSYSIEPTIPQPEGIITQYLSRLVYTIYDNVDDSQLTANYWLEPIRLETLSEEVLSQLEKIPCDLVEMTTTCLSPETNLTSDCKRVLHLSASPQSNRERTTTAPCFRTRRVEVEPMPGRPEKKIFVSPMRGRGFVRTPPSRGDLFRSRPPNTSRPPSLHVDDFLALETCGAQPTGPTGYNKLSRDIISIRGTRAGRGRGVRISSSASYRNASPNTWSHGPVDPNTPPPHFRTATSEPVVNPHFATDPMYAQSHFGGTPIRPRGRGRIRTFMR